MKAKVNLICALVMMGCLSLSAAEMIIKTKSKVIKADSITSNSEGVLTFKAGGATRQLKPGKYIFARIPKPKAVVSADKLYKSGKYGEALKAYDKAYAKYKYLGWDLYCKVMKAKCLAKQNKTKDAISVLKSIRKPVDPAKKRDYSKAKEILTDLNIKVGNLSEAQSAMRSVARTSNPRIIAKSNNKQAEILMKNGKRKDALLMYLRTVLLIDKKIKERKTALEKVIEILKEDKDNKYIEFEKMLKADYGI